MVTSNKQQQHNTTRVITTVTRVITKLLIRWGGWWRAGDSLDNGLSNHSQQYTATQVLAPFLRLLGQSAFIWVITSNLWAVSAARCPPSISFIVLLAVITISLSPADIVLVSQWDYWRPTLTTIRHTATSTSRFWSVILLILPCVVSSSHPSLLSAQMPSVHNSNCSQNSWKTWLSKIFKRKFLCNYGLFGGGSECTNLHLKFYCLFCSCVQNPRRKEVCVHDLFETAGSQVPVSVSSLNFNVRAPGACI